MLELTPCCVHLWMTFPNEIQDGSLLHAYQRLLTEEELYQQKRFYFAEYRHRYLVTRAMLRTLLSRYARTKPEDWRFTENPYGRPEILSKDDNEKSIVFNISHSKDLILCGIVRQQPLGVDVENIQHRKGVCNLNCVNARVSLS